MQICVNIGQRKKKEGKKSSCQQIHPAGQDLKISRFFLRSEILKSITSVIFSQYMSVYCSFLVNTVSLAAGGKSNPRVRSHKV